MPKTERTQSEVVLFYPGDSLARQITAWSRTRPECEVVPVFARTFPATRTALRGADLALIDATRDHALAVDAFSQALSQLGATSAAVYTEVAHDGLELFVRLHGSLLLLGPLDDVQWDGFFERALRATARKRTRRMVA